MLFAFKKTASPVAYCTLNIGMGTRDENPDFNGLAHLTEHMLFKGTENRSSMNINNVLEKVGGELGAYTTKERIAVYSTVLKEDIRKAVSLIFEIAFTSCFPSAELKKEKTVVYDEIITYQDSPADLIYDVFESDLLKKTPLGLPILGEKTTIEKITPEILRANLKKKFIPSNMTFSVAGNFSEAEIEAMVSEELERWRPGAAIVTRDGNFKVSPRAVVPDSAKEISVGEKFNVITDKKLKQSHCIIGCTAYSRCQQEKRRALSLITNILGGPSLNSRLNTSLREKSAMVYEVDASYITYRDTGVFSIYFGCDKSFLKKCNALVKKELDRFVNEKISPRTLAAAKKQLIGKILIANDNAEAQCLSMSKSLLVCGELHPVEEVVKGIEAITAEEIQQVAKEILEWDRMSVLVFE